MKYLIFFILTIISVETMYSQDTASTYSNYFGFSASRVSGYGLMYGTSPNEKVTIQGTIGIFRTSLNSFASYGFELQYNLQNSNNGRIFIGPAVGGFNETYDIGSRNESTASEFVAGFAMGVVVPVAGFFDNRLCASFKLYYPTFYKDNSIGIGLGGTIYFLF